MTGKVLIDEAALGDLIAELVADSVDKGIGSLARRVEGLERGALPAPVEKPRVRVKALTG